MFDSVYVQCPNCGKEAEFQSKGGSCILASYTLFNAPADVLSDVNRHGPVECSCGVRFEIQVEVRAWARIV